MPKQSPLDASMRARALARWEGEGGALAVPRAANTSPHHPESNAMDRPSLTVTTHDARRLEALLQGAAVRGAPMAGLLERELSRAVLVAPRDVPPYIVTMHSRVVCKDEGSGAQHEVELVYPHEADVDRGRISILAPVGTALLGLAVGDAIDWPVPGGRTTRMRVVAIAFQPESTQRLD